MKKVDAAGKIACRSRKKYAANQYPGERWKRTSWKATNLRLRFP